MLVIIGLSIHLWNKRESDERARQERLYADVAAQVWVASATYRTNPERSRQFRDSLLASKGITVQQLYDFLLKHRDQPEAIDQFAYKLQTGIDSLVYVRDSLMKIAADSLKNKSIKTSDTLKK